MARESGAADQARRPTPEAVVGPRPARWPADSRSRRGDHSDLIKPQIREYVGRTLATRSVQPNPAHFGCLGECGERFSRKSRGLGRGMEGHVGVLQRREFPIISSSVISEGMGNGNHGYSAGISSLLASCGRS